jgi:hypothetical protein
LVLGLEDTTSLIELACKLGIFSEAQAQGQTMLRRRSPLVGTISAAG